MTAVAAVAARCEHRSRGSQCPASRRRTRLRDRHRRSRHRMHTSRRSSTYPPRARAAGTAGSMGKMTPKEGVALAAGATATAEAAGCERRSRRSRFQADRRSTRLRDHHRRSPRLMRTCTLPRRGPPRSEAEVGMAQTAVKAGSTALREGAAWAAASKGKAAPTKAVAATGLVAGPADWAVALGGKGQSQTRSAPLRPGQRSCTCGPTRSTGPRSSRRRTSLPARACKVCQTEAHGATRAVRRQMPPPCHTPRHALRRYG